LEEWLRTSAAFTVEEWIRTGATFALEVSN